jgi:hypothetical protein
MGNIDTKNPHAIALSMLRNERLGPERIARLCRIAREAKAAKRAGAAS